MSHVVPRSPSKTTYPRVRVDGDSSAPRYVDEAGREVVIHRMKELSTGTVIYPTLTKTNYSDWALVMKVNLQAQGLWEAIEPGNANFRDDRMALSIILRAVTPDMISTLAVKDTAKQAWDAVKTMRMGVDRVREANAQKLRKEFEDISFKDGETVDDFSMRISGLVNNLRILGDTIEEEKVVQKFLRVVPPRFTQVAISIETLLDLKTMSIEELTGRLRSVEQRYGLDDTAFIGGNLLLTDEERPVRMRQLEQGQGSFGGNDDDDRCRGKSRQTGRGNAGGTSKEGQTTGGHYKSKVKCYNCDKMGHFSRDCRGPRRERREEAHLAWTDDDEPMLLMALACGDTHDTMEN